MKDLLFALEFMFIGILLNGHSMINFVNEIKVYCTYFYS